MIVLRRKAYSVLTEWKSRTHKCLLIKGQRQVGKTYLVRYFASQCYEYFIEVDFSREQRLKALFENIDVNEIVNGLSIYYEERIVPGKTLIFFDEIQDCPRARTSLKAFSEDGRYDVIASGSLLGVSDSGLGSYKNARGIPDLIPMGYEEHLMMRPLDFEEFLWAVGFQDESVDSLKSCIRERRALSEAGYDVLNRHFRDYMLVGGMPESVASFVKDGYGASNDVLGRILDACTKDINRYNTGSDKLKTSECFDAIPNQLSETNKRFMYSRISGGRSRDSGEKYMGNLLWIKEAGYGNFCYEVVDVARPLRSRRDVFKVYMSDTGLLLHMMGRGTRIGIYEGDSSVNAGAIAENIVAQCMSSCGIEPRYYKKSDGNGKMELDFIADLDGELAVFEVKSGKHREYPSLSKAMSVFRVDRAIILEKGNIYVDEKGREHYPLFAAAFIDSMKTVHDVPF